MWSKVCLFQRGARRPRRSRGRPCGRERDRNMPVPMKGFLKQIKTVGGLRTSSSSSSNNNSKNSSNNNNSSSSSRGGGAGSGGKGDTHANGTLGLGVGGSNGRPSEDHSTSDVKSGGGGSRGHVSGFRREKARGGNGNGVAMAGVLGPVAPPPPPKTVAPTGMAAAAAAAAGLGQSRASELVAPSSR